VCGTTGILVSLPVSRSAYRADAQNHGNLLGMTTHALVSSLDVAARSLLPSTSGCAWMAAGRGLNQMRILGIVALGAALGGCASSSADITPAYVSPVMYQAYTCAQLAQEAQAVSTRAASLSGVQDQKRTNDGLATAAAVVIFWPAAFFVGGWP
jgi:hypothetical protein